MKILIVSALYPSNSIGGAEDCAQGFAQWAHRNGDDVQVVTVMATDSNTFEYNKEIVINEIESPALVSITEVRKRPKIIKPFWHIYDHFGRRARRSVLPIIAAFNPDVVVVHYIQGMGYQLIKDIARTGCPIVYVMHDLALACYRMMMFKDGKPCRRHCHACVASTYVKSQLFLEAQKLSNVGFISPSRANLDRVSQYFPIDKFPHAVILNTKDYPKPKLERNFQNVVGSEVIRLLFVGKLQASKGIDLMLAAVERARSIDGPSIEVTVCGGGELDNTLRAQYEGKSWCKFLGFVDQQRIADEMEAADIVCVPSVMHENSPGVVVQALVTGTPVFASPSGGITELIEPGVNGYFVEPTVTAWTEILCRVMAGAFDLNKMRNNVRENSSKFSEDTIGRRTLQFIKSVIDKAG